MPCTAPFTAAPSPTEPSTYSKPSSSCALARCPNEQAHVMAVGEQPPGNRRAEYEPAVLPGSVQFFPVGFLAPSADGQDISCQWWSLMDLSEVGWNLRCCNDHHLDTVARYAFHETQCSHCPAKEAPGWPRARLTIPATDRPGGGPLGSEDHWLGHNNSDRHLGHIQSNGGRDLCAQLDHRPCVILYPLGQRMKYRGCSSFLAWVTLHLRARF